MAVSATVKTSPWSKRLWVSKEFDITLASGLGSTIVNLDTTFKNTPQMLVVLPAGAAGTYAASYDSATPKITVGPSVSGGSAETVAGLANSVVQVVLIAIDKE